MFHKSSFYKRTFPYFFLPCLCLSLALFFPQTAQCLDKSTAPTVSVQLDKNSVSQGESFQVTVSATSNVGLTSAWWFVEDVNNRTWHEIPGTVNGVTKKLNQAQDFGACAGQTNCTYTRTVTISGTGEYEIKANSRDVKYPTPGEAHQASEGAGIAAKRIIINTPPQPPQITGVVPENYSGYDQGTTINASIEAQDPNGGQLEYQFSVDGIIKRPWSSISVYTWDTVNDGPGIHALKFDARNTAGIISTSTSEIYLFRLPLEAPLTAQANMAPQEAPAPKQPLNQPQKVMTGHATHPKLTTLKIMHNFNNSGIFSNNSFSPDNLIQNVTYIGNNTVQLKLKDADAADIQGVKIQLSNDGKHWSVPQKYTSIKDWRLPANNKSSIRQIYIRFKLSSGDWSEAEKKEFMILK